MYRVTLGKDVWGDEREPGHMCLYSREVETPAEAGKLAEMLAEGLPEHRNWDDEVTISITRVQKVAVDAQAAKEGC